MKNNPSTDEAEQLNEHLDRDSKLVEKFRRLFLGPQSPQSPRRETEISDSTLGSADTTDNSWVTGDDPSITCVELLGRGDYTQVYKVSLPT